MPSLQCRAQITSCTSDVLCFVDSSTNKPSRTSWPWPSLSAVRHSSSKPCVPLSTRHDHVLWAARAACLTGLTCCWLGSCAKVLAALMVLRPGVLSCALSAGVKPVYEKVCVCMCVCVHVQCVCVIECVCVSLSYVCACLSLSFFTCWPRAEGGLDLGPGVGPCPCQEVLQGSLPDTSVLLLAV